jgi:hypothetical protein
VWSDDAAHHEGAVATVQRCSHGWRVEVAAPRAYPRPGGAHRPAHKGERSLRQAVDGGLWQPKTRERRQHLPENEGRCGWPGELHLVEGLLQDLHVVREEQ